MIFFQDFLSWKGKKSSTTGEKKKLFLLCSGRPETQLDSGMPITQIISSGFFPSFLFWFLFSGFSLLASFSPVTETFSLYGLTWLEAIKGFLLPTEWPWRKQDFSPPTFMYKSRGDSNWPSLVPRPVPEPVTVLGEWGTATHYRYLGHD